LIPEELEISVTPSQALYKSLKEAGLDFYVSVPCRLLKEIIEIVENDDEVIYTPVTREEEGIGILAGAALAAKRPAILMQNSGLGNSINAICSLLNFYKLSVAFIVSHRGTPGETIDAQKPMGRATQTLFETANVPCHEITSVGNLGIIAEQIGRAVREEKSVAFILPFKFWK
jgi:sulfopyruvate decarboxylase subunit alpha